MGADAALPKGGRVLTRKVDWRWEGTPFRDDEGGEITLPVEEGGMTEAV